MLKKLRVGGVPEHFNYPWHLAKIEGAFERIGVDLEWIDFPGGTGAMTKALRRGEIDLATILTEGIIADIINGNPSKILRFYVKSPLRWGIHVSANSNFSKVEDLQGTRSAISRYGSGSHLMNYVLAKNYNWRENDLNFEEIKNLEGGINALENNQADYFLWERFTTKPFVDKGIFKWLGDCPTPWPCFVIAGTDAILESDRDMVDNVLEVIGNYTLNIKNRENIEQDLAERYDQKIEDIKLWLSITEWENSYNQDDAKNIEFVVNYLSKVGVIDYEKVPSISAIMEPMLIS